MTTGLTKRQSRMLTQAAAPALPELPHTLDGWHWKTLPTDPPEYMLVGPDGWTTKAYQKPPRVVQEAERRALSLPKKAAQLAPAAPAEPPLADDAPADAMPLGELLAILDEYAQARPAPLPLDYVIARPAPLPERFSAPIDLVVAGRWQPRTVFDEAELQDLASSIAEHGVLNPVLVFANEHGQLELIGGERRLRASRLAGKRFISVDVRSYSLRQIAEISAIDNLQRSDLTAVEEGKIFERLISELGVSEAELARRLGRSRGNIQQKRAIAAADPALYEAVQRGELSFTYARTIIGATPGDHALQRQALKIVRVRLQSGQRTTEADVKKLADSVTLQSGTKGLTALGWSSTKFYEETIIWGGAERPRAWSGAEVLEVVRAGRRPSGPPPPLTELDGPTKKALALRGYKVERLEGATWWVVREGWSGPRQYHTTDELAAMLPTVQAEIAALTDAFAAAGWSYAPTEGATYATHPDGAQRYLYDWSQAVQLLAEIQAGKVPTTREAPHGPASNEVTCSVCSTKTREWSYLAGKPACRPCLHTAQTAERERRESLGRRIDALMPTLGAGPAYEALALVARWYTSKDDDAEAIGAFLYQTLTSHVAERLDQARAEALLPPDPGAPAADAGPKVGTLEWVSAGVARIEAQLASGRIDSDAADQLELIGEALEALSDVLDDATYEGLSARLSTAFESLPPEVFS